jgi:hypothetical protein
MKLIPEMVRNLEQQESGAIRRLRCSQCGERSFTSSEQLDRHELACGVGPAGASNRAAKAS